MSAKRNGASAFSSHHGKLHFFLTNLLLFFLLVILGGEFAVAQTKLAAETPLYPGRVDPWRIPVETQGWWTPNFGHVHATALLPLGGTRELSGVVEFDLRITMHNNPSEMTFARVCVESECGSGAWRQTFNPPLTCPYDGTTEANCAWNFRVRIDTTQFPDGWRELRMTGNLETPDGRRFFNSSGIPVVFRNGNPVADYNRFCDNQSLIGRGWYEGFGYSNAIVECVPLEPVSGTITLRFRQQNSSEGGRLQVLLDRTHHIPAIGPWPEVQPRQGRVLFDRTGSFSSFQSVQVDTTGLENGWHSFAVLAQNPDSATSTCSYCVGEQNHAAGVAKFWFYVENSGVPALEPEPEPTPEPTPEPEPDPTSPPPPTIAMSCDWKRDGNNLRCDFDTSQIPAGTNVDVWTSSGGAVLGDNFTKP